MYAYLCVCMRICVCVCVCVLRACVRAACLPVCLHGLESKMSHKQESVSAHTFVKLSAFVASPSSPTLVSFAFVGGWAKPGACHMAYGVCV